MTSHTKMIYNQYITTGELAVRPSLRNLRGGVMVACGIEISRMRGKFRCNFEPPLWWGLRPHHRPARKLDFIILFRLYGRVTWYKTVSENPRRGWYPSVRCVRECVSRQCYRGS